MTIEDVKVIGIGSITLLCLFLFASILINRVDVWAIVRRYVTVRLADEPVRGAERPGANSGAAGSWDLVPRQQHQAEPDFFENDAPDEKTFARQLAREELIIMLAVQRKENGDYLYSANDITKFVGGANAPVKATIANVRGRKETPPPSKSLTRPAGGW